MARPEWMLVITAGLGVALGPGCFRTWRADSTETPHIEADSEALWTGKITSPYHPLPERKINWQNETSDAVATGGFTDAEPKHESKSPEVKAEETPETVDTEVGKNSPTIILGHAPPADPPLVAALRAFMEKRPAEAVDWLKNYDKANQEMLLSLLPLAASLAEKGLAQPNPGEAAAVVEQLRALERPLVERSALSIDRMCLCRKIESYGVYEKTPDDWAYLAGPGEQPGELVQVYVELHNFACKQQGNSFETCLASTLEIHDYKGNLVWRRDFPAQPDRSHSPRHDYFINFRFSVPPHVPPGSYVLWIQVKDLTGQPGKDVPAYRTARRSLDFRVRGTGTARGSWGEPEMALKSGEGDHDHRSMGADGERR